VSKSTLLAFVVAAAVLVGFAVAAVAERTTGHGTPVGEDVAARPQSAPLHWRETEGTKGEELVFGVDRFQVLRNGWRARVSMTNDSNVAYGLDRAARSFGLMLFTSGKHTELESRNNEQALPTLRPALAYKPALPPTLDPHTTWTGTISASGALVAGSWARVVFGELDAIGRTPDTLPPHVVWITDRAYRLRG
jgi:hypothetical protein